MSLHCTLQPWTTIVLEELKTAVPTEQVSAAPFPLSMLENDKMQTCVG